MSSPTTSNTIRRAHFVSEIRPPTPIRIRNRPPNWEFHPSRAMLKRRGVVKYRESSPLVAYSLTSEQLWEDGPPQRPLPISLTSPTYPVQRTSHYGKLSGESSTSTITLVSSGKIGSRISLSCNPQDDGHEDDSGFLCFGGCLNGMWLSFSLHLSRPIDEFTEGVRDMFSRPSKPTPNILLQKNHYTPRYLPLPL